MFSEELNTFASSWFHWLCRQIALSVFFCSSLLGSSRKGQRWWTLCVLAGYQTFAEDLNTFASNWFDMLQLESGFSISMGIHKLWRWLCGVRCDEHFVKRGLSESSWRPQHSLPTDSPLVLQCMYSYLLLDSCLPCILRSFWCLAEPLHRCVYHFPIYCISFTCRRPIIILHHL